VVLGWFLIVSPLRQKLKFWARRLKQCFARSWLARLPSLAKPKAKNLKGRGKLRPFFLTSIE
jgi:hypothetical protein